jgi:putative acetyltransferase
MNKLQLKRTNSNNLDFRLLIAELDTELRDTYNELINTYDQHNVIEMIDTVVIAYADGKPAACGCFKKYNTESAEVKRMFVRSIYRGKGISAMILQELETWAVELGYIYTLLETGEKQLTALSLYQKAGYLPTPNYGPYINLSTSLCYGKNLVLIAV